MMRRFSYRPSDMPGEFDICYGEDNDAIEAYLKPFVRRYDDYIYIIDKNLSDETLRAVSEMTGVPATAVVRVDPARKNVDRLIGIWSRMVSEVPQAAIVIGGGVIGDLAGLACGTYQRGIPRLYFPTTVLAMVDASIGGKSGIDHGDVKNSIGVLHYPEVVVNYVPFLRTLDDGEYRSGFAEVIKAAVLYDRSFFEKLESITLDYRLDEGQLIDMLYESAMIKGKICEEPNNQKLRLLYGHAVGHAYEKLTDGKRRHGDCVAIGMHVEGAMAVLSGHWSEREWKRQAYLIEKFKLPTELPLDVDLDDLILKMTKYKKLVDSDNLYFIVPDSIGHVVNQDAGCRLGFKKSEVKPLLMRAQSCDSGV